MYLPPVSMKFILILAKKIFTKIWKSLWKFFPTTGIFPYKLFDPSVKESGKETVKETGKKSGKKTGTLTL